MVVQGRQLGPPLTNRPPYRNGVGTFRVAIGVMNGSSRRGSTNTVGGAERTQPRAAPAVSQAGTAGLRRRTASPTGRLAARSCSDPGEGPCSGGATFGGVSSQ